MATAGTPAVSSVDQPPSDSLPPNDVRTPDVPRYVPPGRRGSSPYTRSSFSPPHGVAFASNVDVRYQWTASGQQAWQTAIYTPFPCGNFYDYQAASPTVSPSASYSTFAPAPPRPFSRSWESVERRSRGGFVFSVASYNVLCQTTIGTTSYLYTHLRNSREFLAWEHRWTLLEKELVGLDADIFCLQEVEELHFNENFMPFLKLRGYTGVFKKRTYDKPDGCAIFFRDTHFRLVLSRGVEFRIPGTLLDRDNVGLIAVLKPLDGRARDDDLLVVATTHLLFNPKRGDVKLAQLALFLAEVDKLAHRENTHTARSAHRPLVLCGDFNALPLSPLYELLLRGELVYEGRPLASICDPELNSGRCFERQLIPAQAGVTDDCIFCEEAPLRKHPIVRDANQLASTGDLSELETPRVEVSPSAPTLGFFSSDPAGEDALPRHTGLLRNPLKLASVYAHFDERTREPEVSTLHSRDCACVDYIFYGVRERPSTSARCREDELRLLERYRLVSERELLSTCGFLPNALYPSDHLPLMARFELCRGD